MAGLTERARILLVDDRPENLLALEAILSSLDLDLVRAGSGEEALRALLRDDYALILLDAQMPGMDGYETATRIKGRRRTKGVPIIFLTAVDKDRHSAYRGYAAGGADYIAKPFDPWVLRAKVQVFVDLWDAGRQLATQATLLRREVQGEPAATDVVGELDDRITDIAEALEQLVRDLGPTPGPEATATIGRLERSVESMRQALSVLGA